MLVPLLILIAGGGGYWVHKRRNLGMTPARKKIYEEAMKNPPEPEGLRKLAEAFEKAGCKDEALLLRKRAILRELPPDAKAKRKAAFRAGLNSQNADAVLKLAISFESQGATANAAALRRHAAALQKVKQAT